MSAVGLNNRWNYKRRYSMHKNNSDLKKKKRQPDLFVLAGFQRESLMASLAASNLESS